ncbi:hypothetical protein MSG28_003718 [Choristoneura fumiferana]|uniref:Uncharacterized protein n=1 Tax=Choristoneura fumiferana TaxID=7141 RepID=A0ACC0KFU3_CHOFU|nr:hypothetical protein MSG28_003718 [Choristoneura fumiferana]
MPLRTPRRRISPRTVRRYRAIRNFFRKTLGSVASQPDININSSIAVNVTHLKHKIVGIEHQLDEVSKHCRELASIDNISRITTENSIPTEDNRASTAQIERAPSTRDSVDNEARLLYKTPGSQFEKLDNDTLPKLHNECSERDRRSGDSMNFEVYQTQVSKGRTKKNKRDIHYDNDYGEGSPNLRKNRIQPELKASQAFYTSSSHSDDTPRTEHPITPSDYPIRGRKESWLEDQFPGRSPTRDRDEELGARHKDRTPRNKSKSPPRARESKHGKSKRHKSVCPELDQDYIADIIKRQYKPMTMFGRRESEFSQMSTPVCRDQDTYGVPENVVDGHEPCSCCERGPARCRHGCHEVSDLHSLCDARAYSSRRRARSMHRRHYVDPYNDSSLYDIVPVKERSSPKSRRKFVEDMTHYEHYREVPPSPKSQRPRLNLRAQKFNNYEDFTGHKTRRKRSPYQQRRRCDEDYSDDSSDETVLNEINAIYPKLPNHTKNAQIQEDMEKMSNCHYGTHASKMNANLNDALKKTQEIDLSNDKTDKALCEIKDILQSFLQEIKKDTAGFHCDKVSDVDDKANEKPQEECQQDAAKVTTSVIPGSTHNGFNNAGAGQCGMPYVPSFTNPCCYPLMPVCPVNCVQSGFVMPSTSYTCQNCTSQKEPNCACGKENNTFEDDASKKQSETENLIREIYKYVAQIPSAKKESSGTSKAYSPRENPQVVLASRNAGKTSNASKLDANVGTPPLKCYSKSCEALGPRLSDNYYSRTNASFSDTILEKMSVEITSRSKTPSEAGEPPVEEKKKASRFANVMRSFGLLKKRKKNKEVITELSESEKTIEVDVLPRHAGPPFRQEVSNYMMYGQEYYQQPPIPPFGPQRHPRAHSPRYDYRYPPYDPRRAAFSNAGMNDMYDTYRERQHESPPYYPGMHPQASAPPYTSSYETPCSHNLQPQIPLCLKEIEVRSTGTQSERKMPFFKKFSQKKKQSATFLMQEEQNNVAAAQATQNKPKMFSWKQLQAKASKTAYDLEPIEYSLKTQKKLAEGDIKLRDALLAKLLKRKNPFSRKNMLMRTLMAGKESAGWNGPGVLQKTGAIRSPKMFM